MYFSGHFHTNDPSYYPIRKLLKSRAPEHASKHAAGLRWLLLKLLQQNRMACSLLNWTICKTFHPQNWNKIRHSCKHYRHFMEAWCIVPLQLCSRKQHRLSRCLPVFTLLRMIIQPVHTASSSSPRTTAHHVTLDLDQSNQISLRCNKEQDWLIVTHHYVQQNAAICAQIHSTQACVKSSVNTDTHSGVNNCQYLLQRRSSGARLPLRFWKPYLYQEQQTEKAICFVTQRHAWLHWIIALQLWKELFSFYLMKAFRGGSMCACSACVCACI